MIDLEFDTLRLPDGTAQPVVGRIVRVDDSRELVDAVARSHGISRHGA
jgi:hypothetical protein